MAWIDDPGARVTAARLAALQAAAAARPGHFELRLHYLEALQADGRHADARREAVAARAQFGDRIALLRHQARAEGGAGDYEAALATAWRPSVDGEPEALAELAFGALVRLDRIGEAMALADRIDPTNQKLLELTAAQGEAGLSRALEGWAALLARRPWDANARYQRALALARAGRDAEARDALDLADLVEIAMLDAPAGLNDGLAAEIEADPTLAPDPQGKATHGGRQTDGLAFPGNPHLLILRDRIRAAIDAYRARHAAHPIVARLPDAARLRAWAVVYDEGGHQNAHIHPQGWLSGTYCVRAGSGAGTLRLGAQESLGRAPPWDVREVTPCEGQLVLFPSSLPHSATPGAAGRIVVAFDVIPVSASGV